MSHTSESSSLVRIYLNYLGECRLALILSLGSYGYSSEDITVLKDDPKLPDLSQPTRVNMVIELCSLSPVIGVDAYLQLRELERLVAGAVPGDKFTFLCVSSHPHSWNSNQLTMLVSDVDSGHSDQQETNDGPEREEDGKDEGTPPSFLLRWTLLM